MISSAVGESSLWDEDLNRTPSPCQWGVDTSNKCKMPGRSPPPGAGAGPDFGLRRGRSESARQHGTLSLCPGLTKEDTEAQQGPMGPSTVSGSRGLAQNLHFLLPLWVAVITDVAHL